MSTKHANVTRESFEARTPAGRAKALAATSRQAITTSYRGPTDIKGSRVIRRAAAHGSTRLVRAQRSRHGRNPRRIRVRSGPQVSQFGSPPRERLSLAVPIWESRRSARQPQHRRSRGGKEDL